MDTGVETEDRMLKRNNKIWYIYSGALGKGVRGPSINLGDVVLHPFCQILRRGLFLPCPYSAFALGP